MNEKRILALVKRGLKQENKLSKIKNFMVKRKNCNTKNSVTELVLSELKNIIEISKNDPYNCLYLDDFFQIQTCLIQYQDFLKDDKKIALVLFLRLSIMLSQNRHSKQILQLFYDC